MLEAKDTGVSVLQKKGLQKFFSGNLKKKIFKKFFPAISKRGKQIRSSQIFREVFGVFLRNLKMNKSLRL